MITLSRALSSYLTDIQKTKPTVAKPDRYELASEDPLEVYVNQPAAAPVVRWRHAVMNAPTRLTMQLQADSHIGLSEEEERERRANSEVPLLAAVDHSSIEVIRIHNYSATLLISEK